MPIFCINLGIGKKIDLLAKFKECESVGNWRQSIVNHLYWCVMSTPQNADDREEIILEKWLSVIDHVQVNKLYTITN